MGHSSRSASSRAWLDRHLSDPYVHAAVREGYRSRAAYKLIEIDDKDRLLRRGSLVIDLGAAPGSWTQVAVKRLGLDKGATPGPRATRVIALDILPMEPLPGAEFLLGDFREETVLEELVALLGGRKADLILSDMAPNLSGVAVADAARSILLCELALEFALEHLSPEGALLVKCFHGSGYSQFVESAKRSFSRVIARKPAASRQESSETYLLARSLKAPRTSPPRP